MEIKRNYSLTGFNTFSVSAKADFFIELTSYSKILDFVKNDLKKFSKYFILGGGSNVLFLDDFHGLVMAVRNTGVEIVKQGENNYWVTAQAGESWQDLVDSCTDKGLGGVQNLAMIPGNAGSSPIQNIGAYGSEIKDVFHHLEGIFLDTGKPATFSKSQCNFGYRDSIFKHELKNKFLITSITLELRDDHKPDTNYRAVKEELIRMKLKDPGIVQIRDIIKQIRSSKLPDPSQIGNAGSFFKNPVITIEKFNHLQEKYPDIVSFPQPDGSIKLAAGWLIEKAGWKGKRSGDAGVHEKQALVLVNYGNAMGRDIIKLAHEIISSIELLFSVSLETEVNIIS